MDLTVSDQIHCKQAFGCQQGDFFHFGRVNWKGAESRLQSGLQSIKECAHLDGYQWTGLGGTGGPEGLEVGYQKGTNTPILLVW
jgi:hypothetical protein